MGSGSSRIGSGRPSETSRMNRTKRKLSSLLLCGVPSTSASRSYVLESESPVSSIENLPPTSVESLSSTGVSSSFFGSEPVCTSSKTSGAESEKSENCNSTKNTVVKVECKKDTSPIEDIASTSYDNQPILENVGSDSASVIDTERLVIEGTPLSSTDDTSPRTIGQNQENIDLDENSPENQGDLVTNADSERGALLLLSESFLSLRMLESGFGSGGIFLVDVVSSSSDIFSTGVSENNSRESRRDGGGLFWDALTGRNSRRYNNSPSFVYTDGNSDDRGPHDRWLLDLSNDLRNDGNGRGDGYGYSRSRRRNEARRHFRSEMLERGLGGLDEREPQTTLCASGLHLDGSCSCGSSFIGEEASPIGNISRIFLLAQALSEVLDEIHRQPPSFYMSMLSLPAPESVVDSFPLKIHKKFDESESGPNYVHQCYICLVDYEEGDSLRVLPCHHEYHASCVDKWLKEVNGVCPVCRRNVREPPAAAQASVSGSQ